MRKARGLGVIVSMAALAAVMPLGGCVVPIIAGTAAGGYSLATEHRSPEQLARDAAIGATAHKYFADASDALARDVDTTVYEGNLLLTGIVPNEAMKAKADQLARQVQGVKTVYNEIEVGQPTNFGQDARDDYASNALRAQLLADPQVRSTNYIVHTLNGVVYIMGYARNGAERDRVLAYARNLPNVARVVPLIEVGNETGPGAPPAGTNAAPPPPPPPAEEPPPGPPPPPSAPIEVQPLQ